jgi:hypothetical protein
MRWVFGRGSALEEQVRQLRTELEECKRAHERNGAEWREECERLHAMIRQQGETIHAFAQGGASRPADRTTERPIHTYLSQLIPLLLVPLGGAAVAVWRIIREDSAADWVSFSLAVAAVLSLVALRWLPKLTVGEQERVDPQAFQRDVRSAAVFIVLYLLGIILTVASMIITFTT